jgi:ABC-type glycerol-3-phosphate transport system substrate-binding protein
MSNFKIAVLAIFSVSIVIGIALFAMYRAGSGQTTYNLTVWGVLPQDQFQTLYKASSVSKNKFITVNYIQKNATDFDTDFVQALADGVGPDVVLLRDDSFYKNRNRLFVIPYTSYSQRTFKDTFTQETEMFLGADGVTALPLYVDPLVLYWNRDIFANALVASPPKYWDELYALTNKISTHDSSSDIIQSTVPFGEWDNVTNNKEILSLLLLQAGTPIVSFDSQAKKYSSVLDSSFSQPISPAESSINFYTQFSNPTSAYYSWNRALPSSLNFFLSGNLALYIGQASELFSIQQKNPNLNFDVTNIPQDRGNADKVDFAHIYATAIVKQSKSIPGAFTLITSLTEAPALSALSAVTNLPSVRRDLLSQTPNDPYQVIFYNSALIAHAFVDPDPLLTSGIFRDMINSITGGQSQISEAVRSASQSLNDALK